MIQLLRTDGGNKDFIQLVKQLDADLAERDGNDHSFYEPFNTIDTINYVIIAYEKGRASGCGALKKYDTNTAEIKRMFTTPESRGNGIATRILIGLEQWAFELAYDRCVLETGKRQPEAIALYQKNGYIQIPNYGQYAAIENSVCFQKKLHQTAKRPV